MTTEATTPAIEEEIAAFAEQLGGDEPPKMEVTILRVWREILSHIEEGAKNRISPVIANKVLSAWPKLDYSDLPLYWAVYHDNLIRYREIVEEAIQSDPECLNNVDDDAAANRGLYAEIIFQWSLASRAMEDSWDVASPDAAALLAALADAASFVMGQDGLVNQLTQPQVGFEWTEDDQNALNERLEKALSEVSGG